MPDIPEEEQTPLVKALLGILEKYTTRIVLLEETVAGLKDEINVKKRKVSGGTRSDEGQRYRTPLSV